ncbi:hypothetical protein Tco_0748228 [Tanacetum coccineum]|uniref:Uncharacterized protein n=1 Tax=Tanacetum coccineum TaxID=301880 RepID=A0ABQ4YY09_9ASTR
MTTLAEHIIVAGAENHPPMLEKSINGQIRPKKYSELTKAQQLQDDFDVQATNIILHGLPPYVYALVNHQEVAKDIWDRGETLKFVTDVKLAKSLYTTNYDWLYAYLSQHKRHANEVRIMRERYLDPLALVANSPTLYNLSQSPQHSSSLILTVPMLQQGEDLIECINKAMAFMSAVALRFPPSNNQLRRSSNPRNQSTFQDGRVTVQQVQGRQNQSYVGTENRGIATTSKGNVAASQPRESQDAVIQDTNPSEPNDLLMLSLVEQMTDNVAHLDKNNQTNKMVNESLTVELERYKERIAIFEQRLNVDLNKMEKLIDSQIDDLIQDRNAKFAAFQREIDTLKETLSNNVKENESLSKTLNVFKTESKEKESKYIDKEIPLTNGSRGDCQGGMAFCEVGLSGERDGFVLGCRSRGESDRDDE